MADSLQTDFNNEEILVMDEKGELKLLVNGELKPYSGDESLASYSNSKDEGLKPILPMDTGMEEKMIQPPPPMIRKNTASFYFHPEDEEEVARFKNTPTASLSQKRYSLDKIALKVAENYKLALSPDLTGRLRQIIYNFLRNRRSEVDTMDILVREAGSAGLALSPDIAGSLLEFLKEIKGKIEAQSGLVVDEKEESVKESTKFVPPAPVKASQPVKTFSPAPVMPVAPIKPLQPKTEPKPNETVKIGVKTVAKSPISTFNRPAKKNLGDFADVKKDYKLVGPTEELAILNLETFRRLGNTTQERSKKVLSKISLLASDSLAKKAAGINAWRQSPLYQMYVAVGKASMEHDLGVEQVINQYASGGKSIITMEEFEAISDLNRQLRF